MRHLSHWSNRWRFWSILYNLGIGCCIAAHLYWWRCTHFQWIIAIILGKIKKTHKPELRPSGDDSPYLPWFQWGHSEVSINLHKRVSMRWVNDCPINIHHSKNTYPSYPWRMNIEKRQKSPEILQKSLIPLAILSLAETSARKVAKSSTSDSNQQRFPYRFPWKNTEELSKSRCYDDGLVSRVVILWWLTVVMLW